MRFWAVVVGGGGGGFPKPLHPEFGMPLILTVLNRDKFGVLYFRSRTVRIKGNIPKLNDKPSPILSRMQGWSLGNWDPRLDFLRKNASLSSLVPS